ncbi:head decoration protein [Rhizobium sp. KDH_Rht_773_N]
MATITPPNYADQVGIPYQSSDTIAVALEGLLTGDTPPQGGEDMTVAANQNIPARTPLGLDGSGNIVPAVFGTTQAIGFCLIDIVTGVSSTLTGYPIRRLGVYNPNLLNWHASYDTEEKKLEAFRGAASPTQIIMRRPKTGNVVLP